MNIQNEQRKHLTKKHFLRALFLAGLPIVVALGIAILNPAYILKLVLYQASQPCGWLMILALLLFIGFSYGSFLGSFALSNRETVSKVWQFITFAFAVCLLVPAFFIVLLGPAIIMVIEHQEF